jgi:hypothetical protein
MALLTSVVERHIVDLSADLAPAAFGTQPSCTLVASREADVFRRYTVPPPTRITGVLAVNPLYAVGRDGAATTLTLRFPTPDYEEEFGACRRYLPDTVTLPADLTGVLDPAAVRDTLGAAVYDDLRRRLVLIDAPPGYC